MRFSLRSLLFWTTLVCLVIGWVQYHQIDYRWFWPPYRHQVIGVVLVASAHRARAELALPLAVAGLLILLAHGVWAVHLPLYHSTSSDDLLLGKAWFVSDVRENNAFSMIYPIVALLLTGRLALRCRKAFTQWEQILLAVPVVVGSLQLFCSVYLVDRVARGV